MRDLEIRGAGNILGAEQHGHMEAVGYDLYCKLLNEAVEAPRGKKGRGRGLPDGGRLRYRCVHSGFLY